jgi:hypothetical protein
MDEKLFEIISVYFSNTYFCSLYEQARNNFNDERYKTIEIAYRATVESYNNAFKAKRSVHGRDNEHYPLILNKLVEKYNTYMNVRYTFNTFVDLVVRSVVPPEVYSEIYDNSVTKADIVRTILIKTLNEFTVHILTEEFEAGLSLETRDAKDPDVMRQVNLRWKEQFKKILQKQRSEYYKLLIATRHGVDIKSPDNDMVSIEIVKALEGKLRDCISEKHVIMQERNKMAEYARLLIERVRELEDFIEEQQTPAPTPVVSFQPIQQPQPPVQAPVVQVNRFMEPESNPTSNVIQKPTPIVITKPVQAQIQKPSSIQEPQLDDLSAVQAMDIPFDGIEMQPPILKSMLDTQGLEEIDPELNDDQDPIQSPTQDNDSDLDDDDALAADD